MDVEKVFSRINLLLTALAAAFALFISFKFSGLEKQLSVQASEIANNKAQLDLQQAQVKFEREFKLNLLGELSKALDKEKKDTLYCTIAVAFVRDMLADDPMKNSIMQVFESSPFIPTAIKSRIKLEAIQEQNFKVESDAIPTPTKSVTASSTDQILVDVFYVENQNESINNVNALAVAKKIDAMAGYKSRVRQLPASVNLRSGYKVSANEIRFDSDENEIAQSLQESLNKGSSITFQTRLSRSQTKNYVSVFIANAL